MLRFKFFWLAALAAPLMLIWPVGHLQPHSIWHHFTENTYRIAAKMSQRQASFRPTRIDLRCAIAPPLGLPGLQFEPTGSQSWHGNSPSKFYLSAAPVLLSRDMFAHALVKSAAQLWNCACGEGGNLTVMSAPTTGINSDAVCSRALHI